MAKRKKKSSGNDASVGMAVPSSGRSHFGVNIDSAENGFIVNASGGGDGGEYWSKRYIAKDRPEALKISNSCLAGGASKGGKKKGNNKKRIGLKRG